MAMTEAEYDEDQFLLQLGLAFSLSEVPQKKSGPSVSSTATRVLPSRSPQVPSSRAVRPSSSRQGNSNHLAVPLLSSMPRTYAVGRCSAERYAALDKHALSCPASRTQSVASLVSYLKQAARGTEETVRVLHRWVCANISYDIQGLATGDYGDLSADGVLRRRMGVCSGFATLFATLCKEAGVECKEISGVAKGVSWSRGAVRPDSNHAWNAVHLREYGGWALLDCTWSAGHRTNGGVWETCYKDVYFLTRPDIFILDHLPLPTTAPEWTLLHDNPSWPQFRDSLGDPKTGWKPTTHPNSEITCSASMSRSPHLSIGFESFLGRRMVLQSFQIRSLNHTGDTQAVGARVTTSSGSNLHGSVQVNLSGKPDRYELNGCLKLYLHDGCFYNESVRYVINVCC